MNQLKKPHSMIGIWLDINIAIITARWMIVQICMNRMNEWRATRTRQTIAILVQDTKCHSIQLQHMPTPPL
jgi:hypothetical protein